MTGHTSVKTPKERSIGDTVKENLYNVRCFNKIVPGFNDKRVSHVSTILTDVSFLYLILYSHIVDFNIVDFICQT